MSRFGSSRVGLYTPPSLDADRKKVTNITTGRFGITSNNDVKKPWDFVGDRAVQGEVTIILPVNKNLLKARQANLQNRSAKNLTLLGILTNKEDIDMKESDLVWIQRGMVRNKGRSLAISASVPFAFSSMTGINVMPEYFRTQEEFEAHFVLIGRVKIPYTFNSPEQDDSGVSIQVSGACTVRNNGLTTFVPGDFVSWRAYSIDPEIRQMEVRQIRKAPGEPTHKYGPILERATYLDMFKLPQRAIFAFAQSDPAKKKLLLSYSMESALGDENIDAVDSFFIASMRNQLIAVMALGLVFEMKSKGSTITGDKIGKILSVLASEKTSLDADGDLEEIIMLMNVGIMEDPKLAQTREKYRISNYLKDNDNYSSVSESTWKALDRLQINFSRNQFAEFYNAHRYANQKTFGFVTNVAKPTERLDLVL